MPAPSIDETEELRDRERSSHLSHSRINRYLTCPEQYRLYYMERLRPKVDSASHASLGKILTRKAQNCSSNFLNSKRRRFGKTFGVERKFELRVTALNRPFIGRIDLVAEMEDGITVVDFKTATSDYEEHEAILSDQLTAYSLAEPGAEQVALCVLVKTKEPRIEWHFAKKRPGDLAEYLDKVRIVSEDIAAGKFYKRPGRQCAYCDFLPVCLGNQKKARETLVRIT